MNWLPASFRSRNGLVIVIPDTIMHVTCDIEYVMYLAPVFFFVRISIVGV